MVALSFTMLTLGVIAGIALILGAVGLYGISNQRLRSVVPVALSRIDEIDPKLLPAAEHPIHFILRKGLPPLTAELPRADADDRNAKIGAPETAIFHSGFIHQSSANQYHAPVKCPPAP